MPHANDVMSTEQRHGDYALQGCRRISVGDSAALHGWWAARKWLPEQEHKPFGVIELLDPSSNIDDPEPSD